MERREAWQRRGLEVNAVNFRRPQGPFSFMRGDKEMPEGKKLKTATINGLEIFSAGSYNGDKYSESDLDEMVRAFDLVNFKPTVKAGHADGQEDENAARKVFGAPALGYVLKIYRQGKKLLADVAQIPRRFADLINAGAYKRVSAEIYWNWKSGDSDDHTKYPRVLKSIAFLGAEIPAITSLKEIEALYQRNDSGGLFAYDENKNEFHVYDYSVPMAVPSSMAEYLMNVPRKSKDEAGYETEATEEFCRGCNFFLQGWKACSLVEGQIAPDGSCDLFEPRMAVYAKEDEEAQEFAAYMIKQEGKGFTVLDPKGKRIKTWDTLEEAKNSLAGYDYKIVKAASKDDELMEYAIDGVHVYMIRKRGDEWLVLTEDGSKVLGRHKTRESALNQLRAVEANKRRHDGEDSDQDSRRDAMHTVKRDGMFYVMDEDDKMVKKFPTKKEADDYCNQQKKQMSDGSAGAGEPSELNSGSPDTDNTGGAEMALNEKQLQEERDKLKAEFDAKEAELRKQFERQMTDAKADAEQKQAQLEKQAAEEKVRMEARVERLESERKATAINTWIDSQKKAGKLPPAQEGAMKAILFSLPDDSERVVKYSQEGKDVQVSLADAIKGYVENQPSIFKSLSQYGEPDEAQPLSDAGAEIERRVKEYQAKDKSVAYGDALRSVLKDDKELATRWSQLKN